MQRCSIKDILYSPYNSYMLLLETFINRESNLQYLYLLCLALNTFSLICPYTCNDITQSRGEKCINIVSYIILKQKTSWSLVRAGMVILNQEANWFQQEWGLWKENQQKDSPSGASIRRDKCSEFFFKEPESNFEMNMDSVEKKTKNFVSVKKDR